jgi:hypothetical protein
LHSGVIGRKERRIEKNKRSLGFISSSAEKKIVRPAGKS